MDIENVRRKIKALLAVAAPGSGATEHEAATAKALADKLMAEHKVVEGVPAEFVREPSPEGPKKPYREFIHPFGTVRIWPNGRTEVKINFTNIHTSSSNTTTGFGW